MNNSAQVRNGDTIDIKDSNVGDAATNGKLIIQHRQSSGALVRNKRVYFDVETKMHTLNRIENGEAKSAIIREMRLPPSTLATWIKDRERIAELYRHSLGTRKRLRRGGGGTSGGNGAGDKSPTPTTIDVDPSTSAHLGGPFVTPSASDETTAGDIEDDNASKDDDDGTPGEDADEMDSTETEIEDGTREEDILAQIGQQSQQPTIQQLQHQQHQSALPTSASGATIAIPLLRRAPQMVLPRPLIPRATTVAQGQCQQFQQPQPPPPQPPPQQQQQQQPQASVTLRPAISAAGHLPPTAAVSLGAFLTAAPQTSQHHGLLLQQQQQPPPPQQTTQQQQQQQEPITKTMIEDLFQRYTAQLSAILTFTISPIHSSLEQLNRRLNQLQSDQFESAPNQQQRMPTLSGRNVDWLEHTKQHPSEPDKVLVAAETSYQMAIPLAWIRDCCDEAVSIGPERTLTSLLLRAVGKRRLQQLLALGPTALSEDAAFKALRHYVALTQGPVSAQRMCARRDDLLTLVGGEETGGGNSPDVEGASA